MRITLEYGKTGLEVELPDENVVGTTQGQAKRQLDSLQVPSQAKIDRLLSSYQSGQHEIARDLALLITQKFPNHQLSWKVLGAIFGQAGQLGDALLANQNAVRLAPQDVDAHSNLGATLLELGKLEEAEASCRQAIALQPNYADAHNNLGSALRQLGRLEEAEASCRQAIRLKPGYVEAHCNLGNTLYKLGRNEAAQASYEQAIALKPDYAEAQSNLGATLQELGKLEEAEASCRQAIALNPDWAEAHCNLGVTLYSNGDIDSALESLEKAHDIDPKSEPNGLILAALQARKVRKEIEHSVGSIGKSDGPIPLTSNPLFLNRAVEAELITSLYEMNTRELDKTPAKDARYGNGRCSPDFKMFGDERSIIKTVAEDLIRIIRLAVKSEIYVCDSFFNILAAGGGTTPHNHIVQGTIDTNPYLNLAKQKYSLGYYLSVGDQDSSEPGFLKLYDPSEDILPCEGMIAIIPAERKHSAVYDGKKDRVMIGINFYIL